MDFLHYDFMIRALTAGVLISIICPLVGVFLVLRRLSFMADTIAHISLAGVAAGLTLGFHPLLSTFIFSLTAAVGIEKLRQDRNLMGEAVLALVMSTGMALAVVLISIGKGFNFDIFSYLFGSILTVTDLDLISITIVFILVASVIIILRKQLFLISFNEETAKVSGVSVDKINVIFAILIALTVSLAMRIVGVLLVSSLMVIPVVTGLQICRSFKELVISSMVIGFLGTMGGIFFSYQFNLATGGAIVLTLVSMFIVVFSIKILRRTIVKKRALSRRESSHLNAIVKPRNS